MIYGEGTPEFYQALGVYNDVALLGNMLGMGYLQEAVRHMPRITVPSVNGSKNGWDMTRGGSEINGRKYSEHSLERMAPDTPEVRAELNTRAVERANAAGLKPGTVEYNTYINKQIDPRGIPPLVIDDAITSTPAVDGKYPGTFIHQTTDVTVIVNANGDVITVIPK